MAILVTSKYEEDPITIEGARVATTQIIHFSNTQGQITPQSEVGSGRNSNSSDTYSIHKVSSLKFAYFQGRLCRHIMSLVIHGHYS